MKYECKTHKNISFCDEDDYDYIYDIEVYKCKYCNISFYINHNYYPSKEEWDIPLEFIPTTKQIKTIKFINNRLKLQEDCPTRKSAWKFINKYFDKAKQTADNDFYCWCEDNQGWLPECF